MKTDSPADHLDLLRQFQAWRLGDDELEQQEPMAITAAIDWAIAELMSHHPYSCPWRLDICGVWDTGCGHEFINIIADDQEVSYCPWCGHRIEEVK